MCSLAGSLLFDRMVMAVVCCCRMRRASRTFLVACMVLATTFLLLIAPPCGFCGLIQASVAHFWRPGLSRKAVGSMVSKSASAGLFGRCSHPLRVAHPVRLLGGASGEGVLHALQLHPLRHPRLCRGTHGIEWASNQETLDDGHELWLPGVRPAGAPVPRTRGSPRARPLPGRGRKKERNLHVAICHFGA